MKTVNWRSKGILLLTLIGLSAGCSSDDTEDISQNERTTKYVVGFEAFPVGSDSPVDYLLEIPSLAALESGELSVKNQGIPLKGWRFFHSVNNTLFTSGYSDDDKCIAYSINEEGKLIEKNNFVFQSTLDNYSAINTTTLLAVELSYAGLSNKRFHIIDAETGKLEKVVEHPIDINKGDGTAANPGSIPWVTGMILRDNKLFVSYHKWAADGSYVTPDVDRAYIAIFKYPEFELETIIYDERTSPIGVNGHSTGIIKTENNDIYSFSTSALSAGFTSATKPSGVLRIKKERRCLIPTIFSMLKTPPMVAKFSGWTT